MLCEWSLCTLVHDCVKAFKLLMVRDTRAKLIGAPPLGIFIVGLMYRWVPSLQARSDVDRHLSLLLVKVWDGNRCSRYTGDTLVENRAASLSLGAAPSGVNPCPHESILSGLRGLSIRSDRPQVLIPCRSQACVVFNTRFPRKRCCRTFVVNTQAFFFRECFKHAFVVNTQTCPSRECFKHAFVGKIHRRNVSSLRL